MSQDIQPGRVIGRGAAPAEHDGARWPWPSWNTDQAVRWVRPLVYAGCLGVLTVDIVVDVSLFFGLFYIPLVCTAVFHRDPNAAWWLAGISVAMIVLGFFYPETNLHLATAITNRGLSIIAILVTAVLVRHSRLIQDRLAEQTVRTASAEQAKSILLSSLSEEIRTPLHAMIGLTELLISGADSGQRIPLRQIQSGSRRLLDTVETLIDAAQIEARRFKHDPVDTAVAVRGITRAWERAAAERQVRLICDAAPGRTVMAQTDGWAVRRILELLCGIAVDQVPPGTTITLSVAARDEDAAITLRLSSADNLTPVLDVLRASRPRDRRDEFLEPGTAGIGVTLCLELIAAIGAALTINETDGHGVSLTLGLPKAA